MICPQCEAAGQTSRMRMHTKRQVIGAGVDYFDEAGEYHNHDLTYVITPMSCSNGHTWEHRSKIICPTCLGTEAIRPSGDSRGFDQ